jgi:hypothetical protein
MKFDKTASLQESSFGKTTKMEFIGFKGSFDSLGYDNEVWQKFKNETNLSRLGKVLEDKGIAFDQSYAYFGIYSLQEISAYKSKQRYVTFVETEKNSFSYSYNNKPQQIWGGLGAGFIGGGVPLLIYGNAYSNDEYVGDLAKAYQQMGIGFSLLGLVCLIPALVPAKTTIEFNGKYNIYVYDTVDKEIIYKDSVIIGPFIDEYEGSYDAVGTNKGAVINYYSTLVYNEIILKYNDIYKYLDVK